MENENRRLKLDEVNHFFLADKQQVEIFEATAYLREHKTSKG